MLLDAAGAGAARGRAQTQGQLQEGLVQEGHAHLHGVRHAALVGTQQVRGVQQPDAAHRLLVEVRLVGGQVEVQVAAEHLVGALARQHHLQAVLPDAPRQEEHGHGRADRGHVVALQVPHHVHQRAQALLHCEVHLGVLGAQEVGHAPRRAQVGRLGQAHRVSAQRTALQAQLAHRQRAEQEATTIRLFVFMTLLYSKLIFSHEIFQDVPQLLRLVDLLVSLKL